MNNEIDDILQNVIKGESACRVLEISGYDCRYGKFLRDAVSSQPVVIDRVDLNGPIMQWPGENMYYNVYGIDALTDISRLEHYDVIIVFHLFENMPAGDAKELLTALLTKANKQVLVITPVYSYDLESDNETAKAEYRAYHPVFFTGMDFSYILKQTQEDSIQIYSFFPNKDYSKLPVDELPEIYDKDKMLNIAYILAHHSVTGAMKAIYHQMKELAKRGHRITAYYRDENIKTVIPSWIGLHDNEVENIRQITVPPGKNNYAEHISDDEDIIILPMAHMAEEFKYCKIPVALWEQGHMVFFGDYNELIVSDSQIRQVCHYVYRMPVYLLAVSPVIQDIFRGVYNREAGYYPLGVDTGFYYPAEKNNGVPVILLVGNPAVVYKGLLFAMNVLERAYNLSMMFKVQLITQDTFNHSDEFSYVIEQYVCPSQEKIADIYRNADVLLSTSLYESFAMPPLEAMASGAAVIATDSAGINTYAEADVNCLLCRQGDVQSILRSLKLLLDNPQERKRLAANGRKTAEDFSYTNIAPILEGCLHKIVTAAKLPAV